jgi:Concanavalin A-like lectin/glucanases superfamily
MGVAYNPTIVTNGLVLALDAGNKKSYSQNYHPNSLDIYGWYASIKGDAIANTSTLSRDTISSPVGNTPLKMVTTGNDSYLNSYNSSIWNLATAKSGQTWTVSVYAKADISTTGQIFIFEVNSSGNYIEAPAKTINITTNWQRFDYTYTFTNANTTNIQFRLDGADTFNGATIWWDGVQVERGSSATSFTSKYTGENILDICGRLNNGTLTNGPSYSGSNGGTLVFDGVDDRVEVSTAFGILSQYTIAYWARRDAENRMPVSTISGDFYWFGDNSWRYVHGGVAGEYYYSKPTTISLGTWGYYVVVYNGSNVSIYRQGVYQGQQSTTGTANFSSALRIGWWSSNTYAYLGNIANVSFYNRALTASEILQNFNALRTRYGI